MSVIEVTLIVAVILLYSKWISIFMMYPLLALLNLYRNNKSNRFYKILAVPGYVLEQLLRYGGG